MKISGLSIIDSEEGLVFGLVEPYWGAWSVYGWKTKEPGIGINVEVIRYASRVGKDLIASYSGEKYRISAESINNWYKKQTKKPIYKARGGVRLVVVPQSKFEHVKKVWDKKEFEKKELERGRIIQERLL